MAGKFNTKKWLQIGAYATDALSKGSAGGLGKAIVEADVDLSGKDTTGNGQKTNRITGEKHKSNKPVPHDVNGRTGKYSTDSKGRDYDDPMYGT